VPSPDSPLFDTTPDEAREWPLRAYHAAGGVVVRERRVLLVHSLFEGRMEAKLPKGRREEGESLEECALREVREESGLNDPVVVRLLGTGESRFAYDGHRYQRTETYYLMASASAAGDAAVGDWERTLEWCPLERLAVRWAMDALGHRR